MKRTFLVSLSFFLVLNLLVKPLYIFLDTRIINAVGPEAFGVFFPLFNFSVIFTFILDFGLSLFNNRNISQHQHMIDKYLQNIWGIKLMLGIVYFMISLVWAVVLHYDMYHFMLLMVLLLNQFIISFTVYLRSNITALHMFKTDSFLSVLDRAVLVIIVSILLYSSFTQGTFKIEWYVYAQTISCLSAFITTLVILYSRVKVFKIKFDPAYFLAILKESYPFALLTFLMALHFRLDSVMIERMLPDGTLHVGIYAQSYRIVEGVLNNFGIMFGYLLLPIFARMLKQNENIKELLQLSGLLLIVPVIILSSAVIMYNKEIICVLYDVDAYGSSQILALLMVVMTAFSITTIFGTLLTANANTRLLNILTLCALVANIILNIILIPRYQALGCAIAGAVTQSAYAILQMIYCKKIFNLSINPKRFLAIVALIALQIAIGYFVKPHVAVGLGILIILTVGITFAVATKLLNISSMLSVFKEKVQ